MYKQHIIQQKKKMETSSMLNTPNMETTVAVNAVTEKLKITQTGSEELGDT